MKIQATNYTFNAAAKTITFSGLVPANLESILHVANVTTGTLLFQPQAGALFTGTWSSPVLTLACSTTGMANSDRLLIFVEDGATTTVVSDGGSSLTVDGPLTDTQLRATAVPVSGPLTDAQLRATAVPVTTGGLTDAQLRATAVPVSGPLTDTQLRATAVPVSGPLTDGQLRATAVPVSGTVTATGPLTDAQLRATAVPVSGTFWQATQPVSGTVTANAGTNLNTSALAVETGGNLAGINAKLPSLDSGRLPVVLPVGGVGLTDTELRASPVPIQQTAPPFMRVGFAEVAASGLAGKAAQDLTLLQTGSGMTVSQSAGNLVIATGTTANSETVIRSVDTFSGSLLSRVRLTLSQRIVNQTFRVELADLIGDGLSYTINSATSVTVTFPTTNPFTAANVGQSLRLSRITGAAGIPGRYAIASVSGLTVTFTVASWPGSGSGTLSLYGWNYILLEYSGTTATNASFDAQRRGWNSGVTTATISTTAAPGHVAQLSSDVFTVGLADALVASNTGYQWTNRASRVENIPDPEDELYLFIVVQNGSTAPASTTTLTVGFLQIEDQTRHKVRIAGSDPLGSHALPVQVLGGLLGTQPVSGTVTANIGTGSLAAGTNAIGDVGIQARANATGAATAGVVNSLATTAPTSIKASAGRVLSVYLHNRSTGLRSVKMFNTLVGSVTMGTTAAIYEIPIVAGGIAQVEIAAGIGHSAAIVYAVTSALGLQDNTSTGLAAGDVAGWIAFA